LVFRWPATQAWPELLQDSPAPREPAKPPAGRMPPSPTSQARWPNMRAESKRALFSTRDSPPPKRPTPRGGMRCIPRRLPYDTGRPRLHGQYFERAWVHALTPTRFSAFLPGSGDPGSQCDPADTPGAVRAVRERHPDTVPDCVGSLADDPVHRLQP